MPLLNNIYSSIAQISGYKESVLEGINLLNEIKLLKKQNHEDLTNSNIDLKFNLSLSLKNVNFTYPDNSAKVLKNININLEKGKIYGIKGSSGTGKSTLLNIISGLIIPTQGKLFVDNTLINKEKINLWRNKVSLVSQSNFLDETIFENLTISSNINDEQKLNLLVNSSLKTSVLEDFIKNLPNGVHSKIGDNAVRISGGQKQRLAIARALCKKPEMLNVR